MSVNENTVIEKSRSEHTNEKETKLKISSDFVVPRYSFQVKKTIEPEVDRQEEHILLDETRVQ